MTTFAADANGLRTSATLNSIAPILVEVFNTSREKGSLPDSCLQGLISVLYKKKDRDDPRNYRPITLLNCDYKILTRLLATRMNTAVLQFVNPEQNGFVPGGFIAENIMLLKSLQAYVESEDEEALFISTPGTPGYAFPRGSNM